jgi:hypothetical protein
MDELAAHVKQLILTIIRDAQPDMLEAVVKKLTDIGVTTSEDSSLVHESDLVPHLRPIQARKLLAKWSQQTVVAPADIDSATVNLATSPEMTNDENVKACSSLFQEGRPIPSPYGLCKFPDDVQRLLDAGDAALATEPWYRKLIREAICEDMWKYTL